MHAEIGHGTEDISPEYTVKDAVKNSIPSKWLRKKKALEAIYKSLLRFLQNHTEYSPNERVDPVDLDAIAENEDVEQIIQVWRDLLSQYKAF